MSEIVSVLEPRAYRFVALPRGYEIMSCGCTVEGLYLNGTLLAAVRVAQTGGDEALKALEYGLIQAAWKHRGIRLLARGEELLRRGARRDGRPSSKRLLREHRKHRLREKAEYDEILTELMALARHYQHQEGADG